MCPVIPALHHFEINALGAVITGTTVGQIWRYPVNSMDGEHVSEAGLEGDRAFALVEAENCAGSAKLTRQFGGLLGGGLIPKGLS